MSAIYDREVDCVGDGVEGKLDFEVAADLSGTAKEKVFNENHTCDDFRLVHLTMSCVLSLNCYD